MDTFDFNPLVPYLSSFFQIQNSLPLTFFLKSRIGLMILIAIDSILIVYKSFIIIHWKPTQNQLFKNPFINPILDLNILKRQETRDKRLKLLWSVGRFRVRA